MGEPGALTIGEAINLLRGEFPEISVSKIRFLESKGLIRPPRSRGGYRLFHSTDLERIRFILRQQRDHFLPLKVIRARLALWERGEDSPEGDTIELIDRIERTESVSRMELADRSGLTEKDLGELEATGLLASDEDGHFSGEAIMIAAQAGRLLDLGYDARHLRAIRLAAERESDVLTGLASPFLSGKGDRRATAIEVLTTGADATLRLHRALLEAEVRRALGD